MIKPIRLLNPLLAAIGLILAGLLLIQPIAGFWQSKGNDGEPSAGHVLLLTSPGQNPYHYHQLAVGLQTAGYRSEILILPESSDQEVLMAIQAAAKQDVDTWLVAFESGALPAWQAAGQIRDIRGLFLIDPDDLKRLTTHEPPDWPPEWTTVVLTSTDSEKSLIGRDFFEWLSGEDADLFPPYDTSFASPDQYASANGKAWLILYPNLLPEWSLHSIRAVPGIIGWFEDWAASKGYEPAPDQSGASGQSLVQMICLILAGMILLALPQAINLFLLKEVGRPAGTETEETGAADHSRRTNVRGLLHWLPAAILATTAGLAIAAFTGSWLKWPIPALLLLPGCRGWISWAANRLDRVRFSRVTGDESGSRLLRVSGLVIAILTLVLAVVWALLVSGAGSLQTRFALPFLLLVVISWPAGLAGSSGQMKNAHLSAFSRRSGFTQALVQHLPFLLLPIAAAFFYGSSGFAAGFLLLLASWWSSSLGKAVTLAGNRPALGSLAQAVGWSTTLLLPAMITILAVW